MPRPVTVRIALLCASLLALGTACSSATAVGGGCATSGDCASGLCLQSSDFPSGYCSQGCTPGNAASCPTGSVCIDDASGAPADAGISAVCYQSCTTTADCGRTGYACLEKSGLLVCRNGT
jgi:hypothetical protein